MFVVWFEAGTITRLKKLEACPGHFFRQSQIFSGNHKKTGDKRGKFLKIESHWSIILQNFVDMDLSSRLIGRADQLFISKVTVYHPEDSCHSIPLLVHWAGGPVLCCVVRDLALPERDSQSATAVQGCRTKYDRGAETVFKKLAQPN
jgi:hypothetical protein